MEAAASDILEACFAHNVPCAKGGVVGAMQVGLKEVGPDLVPIEEEATGGRSAGMLDWYVVADDVHAPGKQISVLSDHADCCPAHLSHAHSQLLTPCSPLFTPQSPLSTFHFSLQIPHSTLLAYHSPLLAPRASSPTHVLCSVMRPPAAASNGSRRNCWSMCGTH